jgi:hypothetical protein
MKSKKTILIALIIIYTAIWLIALFSSAKAGKPIDHNKMIAAIALSGIFAIFITLAINTRLLRDVVANLGALGDQMPPFSLARTQLALWITIIASLYIYAILWDHKPDVDLNTTALILMGISAGTYAAGAVLDTTEMEQGIPRSQDHPSSGNFFIDIVSDKDGVSVHRFQNVVWTIVAVIVYIYKYNNPEHPKDFLPTLSSTLLALTGISSATYLSLKTRENVPSPGTTLQELKIELVADPAAPASVIGLIANGITTADVKLATASKAGIITATLAPPAPNQYSAKNIPFAEYTINVSGTQVPAAGGAAVSYKGRIDLEINANTELPVKVTIK